MELNLSVYKLHYSNIACVNVHVERTVQCIPLADTQFTWDRIWNNKLYQTSNNAKSCEIWTGMIPDLHLSSSPPKCLTLPRAPNTVWSDQCCSLVAPLTFIRPYVGPQYTTPAGHITWFSHSFYMTPWVHVSSQIASFMCFILEKQTDYDCADVATVKVPLITCLLRWHCTVSKTLLKMSSCPVL